MPEIIEIPDIDEAELGPKMLSLTSDNHRRFVWYFVHNGGNSAQAAEDAGFGNNKKQSATAGWRLSQRADVKDAIAEVTGVALRSLAAGAVKRAQNILNDPNHKDHAKVVLSIMDRVGLSVETKKTVQHNHLHANLSEADLAKKVMKLAEKHGMDGVAMLKQVGVDVEKLDGKETTRAIAPPRKRAAVDADFKTVDGSEGLEDILG